MDGFDHVDELQLERPGRHSWPKSKRKLLSDVSEESEGSKEQPSTLHLFSSDVIAIY